MLVKYLIILINIFFYLIILILIFNILKLNYIKITSYFF